MFKFAVSPTAVARLAREDCLRCDDCEGVCREVVDLFVLPGIVLGETAPQPDPQEAPAKR